MTGTPAGEAVNGSAPSPIELLPQMIAQAFASVLQQVPVQTRQHLCAPCVLARMTWDAAHQADLRAAAAAAVQAAGLAEGDPRAAQLDPAPFLPPAARQSLPDVQIAVTTAGGTEYCAAHVPGRPGGQKLLLASGPLSSAMLSGLG
jgi:hypothetical protein